MSLDINNLASEFGCTIEDVKELIDSFIQESADMFEVISVSIDSSDFEHITMGAESIKISASHLNLNDMQNIAEEIISCSTSKSIDTCSKNFATMQSLLSELKEAI